MAELYNNRRAPYSSSIIEECGDGKFSDYRHPHLVVVGVDRSPEKLIKTNPYVSNTLEDRGILCDRELGQYLIAGRNTPLKVKSARMQLTRHWTSSTASITLVYDPPVTDCSTAVNLQDIRNFYTVRGARNTNAPPEGASIPEGYIAELCNAYFLYPEAEVRIFGGYTNNAYIDSTDWQGTNWLATNSNGTPSSQLFPMFWGVIDTISVQGSTGPLLIKLELRDKLRYYIDTHTSQEIAPTAQGGGDGGGDKGVLSRTSLIANIVAQTFWKVSDPTLGSPTPTAKAVPAVDKTKKESRGATKALDCNPPALTADSNINYFYRFSGIPQCVSIDANVYFSGDTGKLTTDSCSPLTLPTYTQEEALAAEALIAGATGTEAARALKIFRGAYNRQGTLTTSGFIKSELDKQLQSGNGLDLDKDLQDDSTNRYNDEAARLGLKAPVTPRKIISVLASANVGGTAGVEIITASDFNIVNNALKGELKYKELGSTIPTGKTGEDKISKRDAYLALTLKSKALSGVDSATVNAEYTKNRVDELRDAPTGVNGTGKGKNNEIALLIGQNGLSNLDPLNPDHKVYFESQGTGDKTPLFFIYTARGEITQSTGGTTFRVLDRPPIDILRHLANTEVHPTEMFVEHTTGHIFYIPRATAFVLEESGGIEPVRMYSYLVNQEVEKADKTKVIVPPSIIQFKMEWSTLGVKTDFHLTNQQAISNGSAQGQGLHVHLLLDERLGIPNYAIAPRNLFLYDETAATQNTEEAFSTMMAVARVTGKDTKVGTLMIPGDPAVRIGDSIRVFNTAMFSQDTVELSDKALEGVNKWDQRLQDIICRMHTPGSSGNASQEGGMAFTFADTFGLGAFSEEDTKDPYVRRQAGSLFRVESITHHFVTNTRQGFITELLLGELY